MLLPVLPSIGAVSYGSYFFIREDRIRFDTKFQRGLTWKLGLKQYFMDTVRRNWQTSKIFFWKTKPDEYVCVDGPVFSYEALRRMMPEL